MNYTLTPFETETCVGFDVDQNGATRKIMVSKVPNPGERYERDLYMKLKREYERGEPSI